MSAHGRAQITKSGSAELFHFGAFQYYVEWARTQFWLIPTALCGVALIAAVGALYLDENFSASPALQFLPALALDSDAARSLMGILATSVIGVAGVSFSITMVALSLTSGQYGPKVIRHFLASTSSKISLGLFFSTALFALTVFIGLEPHTVPKLSVMLAMLLAGLALIEFMRFIHRTTSDLQADEIIQRLGLGLRSDLQSVVATSKSDCARAQASDSLSWRRQARERKRVRLMARSHGYVQTIDYANLVATLEELDLVALLRIKPGGFVVPGQHLLTVWHTGSQGPYADSCEQLIANIVTGEIRTAADDPEYPMTQIQQIAARALSPGINDPGTAISCVDSLTLALSEVVDKDFRSPVFVDSQEQPRLLIPEINFATLLHSALSSPRRLSSGNLPVAECLMHSIMRLMELTQRTARLQLLKQQAQLLFTASESGDFADKDLSTLRRQYKKICRLG